jgi:hypothetical protein
VKSLNRLKRRYVQNIMAVFQLASGVEITSGIYWYGEANKTAQQLSEAFGIPVESACLVISALSPNNSWTRNISDAWKVCRCWHATNNLPNCEKAKIRARLSTCTYGANKAKAFEILDGKRTELGGLKTQNFARNLAGCEESVTIDVHAFSIANNKRFTAKSMDAISPTSYSLLAESYTDAAKEIGIAPSHLQAITWQTWRRIHGLTTAQELTGKLF